MRRMFLGISGKGNWYYGFCISFRSLFVDNFWVVIGEVFYRGFVKKKESLEIGVVDIIFGV